MAGGAAQRTLARRGATFKGVGLHGGDVVRFRILPAGANEGIAFVRTDLDPKVRIPAAAQAVSNTSYATTLGDGDASVSTVEHLLCALCLCGVDNAVIEVDGPEIPIMDGSAMPFILYLMDTGLVEQEQQKSFIKVKKKVELRITDQNGSDKMASFEPGDMATWHVDVDFTHPVIRRTPQACDVDLASHGAAVRMVAGARTFGFAGELEMLRKINRALGGSLSNAVVLNGNKVLNENGLRQPNEFVAHKLLDVIGDCYIGGKLVLGQYCGTRSGHELNNKLMRGLGDDDQAWELVGASDLPTSCLPDFGPLGVDA